jgi:hypothetical protein
VRLKADLPKETVIVVLSMFVTKSDFCMARLLIILGSVKGRIEGMGRRGRRRKELLCDLKGRREITGDLKKKH